MPSGATLKQFLFLRLQQRQRQRCHTFDAGFDCWFGVGVVFARVQRGQRVAAGFEAGLEALKLFAEHHAETTKIAPGSCELCFYYAGLAMAQLGTYYRTEVLILDRRLQDGTPAEVAAIEAEIEESEKIMRGYFLDSNRYFETYIRQAGAVVITMAYWKLADNYAALEDWRRALSYLDVFEKAQPLAESQNDLPAIRSSFQKKLRLQEERQLDEELQRSGTRRSQRPQMSN